MTGQLVIKPQLFEGIPTYGIFLHTDEVIEGLECWQGECAEIFVGYSRTMAGAERAVSELGGLL